MIGISWLIPGVVLPAFGFDNELRATLYRVFLETIPVLLTMKILIRRQPRRNYLLAGSFTAALLVLGARGMLGV